MIEEITPNPLNRKDLTAKSRAEEITPDTAPEDWYANYRREVEAAYAERDWLNVNRMPTDEEMAAAWFDNVWRAAIYARKLMGKDTP